MGEDRRRMEGIFAVIPKRDWGFRRQWKRHDVILCVGGLLYMLIGLYYTGTTNSSTRNIALEILLRVAPMKFWGGVFIFAGIAGIISSRWPAFAETWGYVVLTSVSAGWAGAYLMGILFASAPLTNIISTLVFGLFAFMWWAVSGLLNPDKTAVATIEARPT